MFMNMWENSTFLEKEHLVPQGDENMIFYARYGLQSLVAGIGDLPVGAFCQGVKQWIWLICVANIQQS